MQDASTGDYTNNDASQARPDPAGDSQAGEGGVGAAAARPNTLRFGPRKKSSQRKDSEADARLAAVHGVAVAAVVTLRETELREGEHYSRNGRGALSYTSEGEAALAVLLEPSEKNESPPAPVSDSEKKEAPPPPAARASLMIVRLLPNPLFVLCRTPSGDTAAIQVQRRARLALGKAIECEQDATGSWHCIQPTFRP